MIKRAGLRAGVMLAVLSLVAAGGLGWVFSVSSQLRITAYFDRAVGVYPGSDVQVLGVRVGSVESVTPRGDRVEVVLTIAEDTPVAADTSAVVIAPSVVADRSVQLTTPRRGGPRIADGTVIPVERTATPVELDELYASLDELTTALGPRGANADGALSELLDTAAANLRDNGTAVNETVRDFAALARTLADSRDDLFGTVEELRTFVAMLAANDRHVAGLTDRLASVWQTLAEDRTELSGALRTLAGALGEIQGFIRDNRAAIKSNVDKLARTTQLVVDNRASLAEALDIVPLAVTNLENAFDPASSTVQSRTNLLEYLVAAPPGGLSAPLPLPPAGPMFVSPGQEPR
jgi:virulence factor Mce-like protein